MNPVLQKDLLGLLRLKRVAAVQVLFVAVLAVMVLGSWPQQGVLEGNVKLGSGGATVASGDRFLLGLTLGQIVLLVLFVPGTAAVAVSSEQPKRQRPGDRLCHCADPLRRNARPRRHHARSRAGPDRTGIALRPRALAGGGGALAPSAAIEFQRR